MEFIKLSTSATTPSIATSGSAGYDLYSAYNYTIQPDGKELVSTDIALKLPKNYYGRIAPRSGLAWKNSIQVGGGVIDNDYRGNIKVILFNHSRKKFKITKGMKIVQIICTPYIAPELIEVMSLNNTARGSNGFGSSDD